MKVLLFLGAITILVVGCANSVRSCTTSVTAASYYPETENNYQCPVGQVLVGYNTHAINGPLLCAATQVVCPVPGK